MCESLRGKPEIECFHKINSFSVSKLLRKAECDADNGVTSILPFPDEESV